MALRIIPALLGLSQLVTAGEVRFATETDQCHFVESVGSATCCCNGDCLGGRPAIGDWTWGVGCIDYSEGPSCSETQIYHSTNESTANVVGDNCYGTICQWERWQYKSKCCDCPAGYKSTVSESPHCDSTPSCVGCTDPWETPVRIGESRYTYECRPKGLDCATVDTMARNYDIAVTNGPLAVGYYGQMLNLVCLRSHCAQPACDRVKDFASSDAECQNLSGSFTFEEAVFSQTAKSSTASSVADAARDASAAGVLISGALKAGTVTTLSPFVSLAIEATGITDPETWGTTYAGISHFSNDLNPHFETYIRGLIKSTPNKAALQTKLRGLAAEHERLFKCAVEPGFKVQSARGEILPVPAAIGAFAVPIAARILRGAIVHAELASQNRTGSIDELEQFGITLPKDTNLIWNPRNWGFQTISAPSGSLRRDVSPINSKPASVLAELSSETEKNPLLSASGVRMQIMDRKDGIPASMARMVSVENAAALEWKVKDKTVQVVGRIVGVYPAQGELVMWNATHVVPQNVTRRPASLEEALKEERTAQALMFEHTRVELDVGEEVLGKYKMEDLRVYDLVGGVPLEAEFRDGTFVAEVKIGKGGYEAAWGGGGAYGIGLAEGAKVSSGGKIRVSWGLM
ncbi:hypothetical protein OQA88_7094 [Cercophora sp. LCS_1]